MMPFKKTALIIKQLLVSKQDNILNSNFLFFYNEEFLSIKIPYNQFINGKKVQKFVYQHSNIIDTFSKKSTIYPLKVLVLNDTFQLNFYNKFSNTELFTAKFVNLFIQLKKQSFLKYIYSYSYKMFNLKLFLIRKIFV